MMTLSPEVTWMQVKQEKWTQASPWVMKKLMKKVFNWHLPTLSFQQIVSCRTYTLQLKKMLYVIACTIKFSNIAETTGCLTP